MTHFSPKLPYCVLRELWGKMRHCVILVINQGFNRQGTSPIKHHGKRGKRQGPAIPRKATSGKGGETNRFGQGNEGPPKEPPFVSFHLCPQHAR